MVHSHLTVMQSATFLCGAFAAIVPLTSMEEVAKDAARKEATCWESAVDSRDYPYFATVVTDCDESFQKQGIIISEYYVLTVTDSSLPKTCGFTVKPGSDGQGNIESGHKAEMINVEKISLFKLMEPIHLNAWAQPIGLVDIGKRPESDDSAIVTSMIPESWNRQRGRRVFKADVTIKNEQDCRDFVSQWRPDQSKHCQHSLWIETSNLQCPLATNSALIKNGRLAGISGMMPSFGTTAYAIDGFLDISHYRATIKNLTGV